MATQPGVKILLTGGGSGGHITPILAVAEELKQLDPETVVVSVGERGGKFGHLTKGHSAIDRTHIIFAGKFRRYHGESGLKRLLDVRTNVYNLRDAVYVMLGLVQAVWLLHKEKPDVVFLKGGFVGVPVGLAAALRRTPIITHDSDVLPGLANRLVGRWAVVHATGMPAKFYNYPAGKVRYVGVLVNNQYQNVTESQQQAYKRELGLEEQGSVLLVTGGSLGARRINQVVVARIDALLTDNPKLSVVHQVGQGKTAVYGNYTHPRLTVLEFLDGMHRYSGAADIIVTRAGANTIAEFGIQGKACIVIPSPFLAGGHQLKNGEYLAASEAAVVLDELAVASNPEVLQAAIQDLLDKPDERVQLAAKLQSLAVPDAAIKLAQLLLAAAKQES